MFLWNLIDFIFPNYCVQCQKRINYDSFTCEKCASILQYSKTKVLSQHGKIDILIAAFPYQGIIQKEILAFKFHHQRYLKRAFANMLILKIIEYQLSFDMIIPVPISKKRYKERGYNQSKEIASIIAKKQHKALRCDILQKIKDNPRQSLLSKEQRKRNVKGVYQVKKQKQIIQKSILLVDDIYTTGATALECASILKQSGAKKVIVLTIAYA